MKKIIYTLIISIITQISLHAQDYYFKFNIDSSSELRNLTKIISIDNVRDKTVYAYANKNEFNDFLEYNYKYQIIDTKRAKSYAMATTLAEMESWDKYPTYELYIEMMQKFETDYPDLCKLVDIGTSVDGRKLIAIKISDNVEIEEEEPEVFYTSTMHGDETAGYIILLRLMDYMLNNYNSDTQIQRLINELQIYINPNANPDGTYYGGNSTVSSARRYNINNIDINRDFPDPKIGDNAPYQPETQAMMDFASNHHFVFSANFHGGVEVLNYPWDAWKLDDKAHPDTEWYQKICNNYVATAREQDPEYLKSDKFPTGVTNGGDWYVVYGGRQDYMNYWHHCKEITIELSNTKLLSSSQLLEYWEYNYQALLNMLECALQGVKGRVTDMNNNPLAANLKVLDHDKDNSNAVTNPETGIYYRLLLANKTYDFAVMSEGYTGKTVQIQTTENDFIIQDFQLDQSTDIEKISQKTNKLYPIPAKNNITLIHPNKIIESKIYTLNGQLIHQQNHNRKKIHIDIGNFKNGTYIIWYYDNEKWYSQKFLK